MADGDKFEFLDFDFIEMQEQLARDHLQAMVTMDLLLRMIKKKPWYQRIWEKIRG